jgi:hypothetical protein
MTRRPADRAISPIATGTTTEASLAQRQGRGEDQW